MQPKLCKKIIICHTEIRPVNFLQNRNAYNQMDVWMYNERTEETAELRELLGLRLESLVIKKRR